MGCTCGRELVNDKITCIWSSRSGTSRTYEQAYLYMIIMKLHLKLLA